MSIVSTVGKAAKKLLTNVDVDKVAPVAATAGAVIGSTAVLANEVDKHAIRYTRVGKNIRVTVREDAEGLEDVTDRLAQFGAPIIEDGKKVFTVSPRELAVAAKGNPTLEAIEVQENSSKEEAK